MLGLVLLRRPIAQGRVETFAVVDLLQEVGEPVDRVLHRGLVVQVDLLVFQGFHEALHLQRCRTGCRFGTWSRGAPPPPGARGSATRHTAPPDPSDAGARVAGGDSLTPPPRPRAEGAHRARGRPRTRRPSATTHRGSRPDRRTLARVAGT